MTGRPRKARRDWNDEEQALQKACVEWLVGFLLPTDPIFWTAINPVPAKSRAVAGLSKAMGLRAGAPDMILIYDERVFGIEFKRPGASKKLSDNQKIMRKELFWAGGSWRTIDNLDEFILFIKTIVRREQP